MAKTSKELTKDDKRKKLYQMVEKLRRNVAEDDTCQYKGGRDERFCRLTSRKTCSGCKRYSISVWELYAKCYDLITQKDQKIMELEDQVNELKRQRAEGLRCGL